MKDKQVEKLIKTEQARQKKVVNLIASENYVSRDVLDALGSELTNKYLSPAMVMEPNFLNRTDRSADRSSVFWHRKSYFSSIH